MDIILKAVVFEKIISFLHFIYTYDLLPSGREDKNTASEPTVSRSKRFHLRSRNFKKCVYNGRVRVLTTWIGWSESDIHMRECVNKTYDLLISFFILTCEPLISCSK